VVGKKLLTGGAQVSAAEREKTPQTEGVKSRRKRISHNTPTTHGTSGCEASGPGRGRRLGPAGRPRPGWAGGMRPVGRVEVAAWRENGGGPAGENGLGLIGQPGQKYSRIRKIPF
jgi:hypothetical protein